MFDIGFWEISLIFIIALLVVGPERLPRVARDVGLWVGKMRRYVAHVRSDIEREINAQEVRDMLEKPKELDDLYDIVEETKGTLNAAKDTLKDAQSEADSWTNSIEEAADSVGDKAPELETADKQSTPAAPVPDKPGAATAHRDGQDKNGQDQDGIASEHAVTAEAGSDSRPPRDSAS